MSDCITNPYSRKITPYSRKITPFSKKANPFGKYELCPIDDDVVDIVLLWNEETNQKLIINEGTDFGLLINENA